MLMTGTIVHGPEEVWNSTPWRIWTRFGEILGLDVWEAHCSRVLSVPALHGTMRALICCYEITEGDEGQIVRVC